MCVYVYVYVCAREKVGQGERDGQPQFSASANVLTARLNIFMCHELFVSRNVCLFACVCVCLHVCVCMLKVLWDKRALVTFVHSDREPSLFLSTRSLPAVHPSA